ncbi:MAG: hypothetical protein CMA63_01505 [Euryarchaeota archaeon]|nr:hypothetical protein [Euryarchaeota archaeon]|tara:strand:- start:26619 stop:27284 length:666 start_codon:yes stop_codon:yes gene_type:complete
MSLEKVLIMREIQLRWNADTVASSAYAPIAKIAHSLEVVGHLDLDENGIRQLIRPDFCEGMGPEDLNEVPFLNVDPAFQDQKNGYIVVWNSHPLTLAGLQFSNIHILPPYTYGGEGISLTVRGVPEGISEFLKICRLMLPPDVVKVVEMGDNRTAVESILTPRQIECIKMATSTGYYDLPKKIKLRELSELIDIPRSTLQEHLNRAEIAMMKWASQQLDDE